jgi:hypothetical protein
VVMRAKLIVSQSKILYTWKDPFMKAKKRSTALSFLLLFLKIYLGIIAVLCLLIFLNALIGGTLNELTLEKLFGFETLKILGGLLVPAAFILEIIIQDRSRKS